jgi:hypothetical protein
MAQRIMINKIASSVIEKAQGSMEPKAAGVKIRRKMRRSLMKVLIIGQSLVYCGVIQPSLSRSIGQGERGSGT